LHFVPTILMEFDIAPRGKVVGLTDLAVSRTAAGGMGCSHDAKQYRRATELCAEGCKVSASQRRDELKRLLVSKQGHEVVALEKFPGFCAIDTIEIVDPKAGTSRDFGS